MTLHTPSHHRNSMLVISQLLLSQFWWNFKRMFLGTSKTDSNYQVEICSGNICPGYICSYQEYLSCYLPDFDETLKVASWEHLEQIPTIKLTFLQATFVLVTFVHISNISAGTDLIWMKLWMKLPENIYQIPSIKLTFVLSRQHLSWGHSTFVHIRNISAVTDPMLIKL